MEDPWPRSLQALQMLDMMSSVPVSPIIQDYGNLRKLGFCIASTLGGEPNPNANLPLPDWFSQLTQLKSLTLPRTRFATFPSCLLSLTQLETLSLPCNSLTCIPMDIMTCASWPSLTRLDICGRKPLNDASLDSNIVRLQLQAAFVATGRQRVLRV